MPTRDLLFLALTFLAGCSSGSSVTGPAPDGGAASPDASADGAPSSDDGAPDAGCTVRCPKTIDAFCGSTPDLTNLPECAPTETTEGGLCGGGASAATCGPYPFCTRIFPNETYATAYYDATEKLVAIFEDGSCAAGPATFALPRACAAGCAP